MPQTNSLDALLLQLATAPVGIGEEHDNQTARKEIYWLIRHRKVRGLIVELSGLDLSPKGFSETLEMVDVVDNMWKNPIPLAYLIRAATLTYTRIYDWDPGLGTADERNGVIIDKFLNHFDPGGMNPATAMNMASGHIFLFGADHFGAHMGSLNMRLGDALHWIELT